VKRCGHRCVSDGTRKFVDGRLNSRLVHSFRCQCQGLRRDYLNSIPYLRAISFDLPMSELLWRYAGRIAGLTEKAVQARR